MDGFNMGQYSVQDAAEQDSNIVRLKKDPIGVDEIKKATETLRKYKEGKSNLENRIVANEKWWKMRHWDLQNPDIQKYDPKHASGYLFNCIMSKHADFMDSFPDPAVLPRELGDVEEAKKLTSILPVILEQNEFEQVYSDEVNYKLKNGTGCYGVFWDKGKLNGLGDITIKNIDLLTLFWEPGVTNIQDSQNVFVVELVDNKKIENAFPAAKGKLGKAGSGLIQKYMLDDNIPTDGKSSVVDWYYKKNVDGKQVLHYCKFVDEVVLYASENDDVVPTRTEMTPVMDANGLPMADEMGNPILRPTEIPTGEAMATKGWYDHGQYPFVIDVLFKQEAMITGFGFVDVCKNAQMSIDQLNAAIEKSAQFNAHPRYFSKIDGAVNDEEFMDPSKTIVHVNGQLGDDSLRPIETTKLDGIYLSVLQQKIDELKETSGNRDTANGGTQAGVTAASAIAAMQEQSGKSSRDMIKASWRAFEKVCYLCIELMRQFYDMPREFRILGSKGEDEFVTYQNAGLQPQPLGNPFGVDMGFRLPVFDIKVQAQKQNKFSQLSQNEMALQFYNAGFFNPQNADQALAVIGMMEFQGKEEVMDKIEKNGTLYQQLMMAQQQILMLSQMVDASNGTNLADQMAAGILGQQSTPVGMANPKAASGDFGGQENRIVENARERAAGAASPT